MSGKADRELYEPFVSTAKNKKYSVYVKRDGRRRLIHFGDSRYGQFHDKIGHYSSRDHNDQDRRRRYLKRHGHTNDMNTAKWWSQEMLW